MIVLIWTAVLIAALLMYFKHIYSAFKNTGVKHLIPIPPFGNLAKSALRQEHMVEAISKVYNTFPEDRFVGYFEFINHVVVLRDLELIKKVTLKDFDYFEDHRVLINENNDSLFGRGLFSLKGSEWRDMRSTLSPAFTSSKMRLMVPFMTEVGEQMNKVLKDKLNNSDGGYIDLDVKDLTNRYANDVIASCAFGLKVNSHADTENEFYEKGRLAATFTFTQMLKFLGFSSFPKLMNFFKVSLFSESTKNYFRSLVGGVIKEREERNIIRNDMINLLIEAKKGKLEHSGESTSEATGFATVEESSIGRSKVKRDWTDDDLAAQAILFFIAGFDTVSTAITFMLYELAINPDIQEKLYQEILETNSKNDGKFDFNSIQQMVYMDQVVSETLRLWTPGAAVDRLCVKDYNLGKPNDHATKDYIIKKGQGLYIPIWAIQRNPDYYPDPKKFDPERFSHENQHNIKPMTYLPFGVGPRNCIGSRFALCEAKVMIYQLLRDLEISPSEKTPIPMELDTGTFNLRWKGGHWLRFRARNP